MSSKLVLVENAGGWVSSPIVAQDVRRGDKVIAVFESDLFYTAEEQFWLFDEYVYSQEGHNYCHYNYGQLKELYNMWMESLNK